MNPTCIDTTDAAVVGRDAAPTPPVLVVADVDVDVRHGDRRILAAVDVSLVPGEVLAVAGHSGSGKTTLLRVLAGLQATGGGRVVHARRPTAGGTPAVGYVPQDDIVHRELSVRSTLRYAAALRLPADLDAPARQRVVEALLDELGLGPSADVGVGVLSGGQRKRVSMAVELLGRPDVLLLDEPTSGLDPATAADVVALLRRLAARGVAVAFTTHRETDVETCDRVLLLGRDGRVAYDGALDVALHATGARGVGDLYRRLDGDDGGGWPVPAPPDGDAPEPAAVTVVGPPAPGTGPGRVIGPWHQALLLTRRNAEVMARNRLTLAVLLGSPLLVTAMMATLFGAGSFGGADPSGLGPVQVTFWLAFAGFFFGLTYGLLQIVTERAVLERERFAGLSTVAYLASKFLVLAPLLAAVAGVLVGTLTALDRLPAPSWAGSGSLLVTLVLASLGALALGLLASAVVRDAAQATLALPMLCFPQVLFAGAVVPVVEMTAPGRALSTGLGNRWAFESLGRSLDLGSLGALPGVAAHGVAFEGSPTVGWLVLGVTAALLAAVTVVVLRRTTPAPHR